MTDVFRERGKGFEGKYRMDQDLQFKVCSRRDKLFGLWLAERFGLVGNEADAYALEVVASNFERPGDDDLLEKVQSDIATKNVTISEKELLEKFNELLDEAHDQVTKA